MGKPGHQSSALVAVQVDEEGKLQTDMIVKQGSNRNKIVQTQMKDIKEKKAEEDLVVLPSEQEEYETAERTKQALEMLLDGEIKSTKTSTINTNTEAPEPTYIRYTPNPNAPG